MSGPHTAEADTMVVTPLSFTQYLYDALNLQATKLFIVTSATIGVVVTTPLRFSVRFKILHSVIQRLIQHCLLRQMAYLNRAIVYAIATRNYDFLIPAMFRN